MSQCFLLEVSPVAGTDGIESQDLEANLMLAFPDLKSVSALPVYYPEALASHLDPEARIAADPDQEGLWLWRIGDEGCESSFLTQEEAATDCLFRLVSEVDDVPAREDAMSSYATKEVLRLRSMLEVAYHALLEASEAMEPDFAEEYGHKAELEALREDLYGNNL